MPTLVTFDFEYSNKDISVEFVVRALFVKEEELPPLYGRDWLFGVNPGAIASTGGTLEEAILEMKISLGRVIDENCGPMNTFEEKKLFLENFYSSCDPETQSEWDSLGASGPDLKVVVSKCQ